MSAELQVLPVIFSYNAVKIQAASGLVPEKGPQPQGRSG